MQPEPLNFWVRHKVLIQQINRKTCYKSSKTWNKPGIKSTNQQCFATFNSEFFGLAQAQNQKINKSTAKCTSNTETMRRNPIQNQHINSDLQPVALNFWVRHTYLQNQEINRKVRYYSSET